MQLILGILAIIGLFLIRTYKPSKKRKSKKIERPRIESIPDPKQKEEKPKPESDGIDYSQSYQQKYLLSKNEWYEYKKLKSFAERKELQVFPKVRLLDIIEPRRGIEHYKSLFYKIQAKHIDFLICDQNAYIKAIVELDDNSHDQADRQERDKFVDQILNSVGYKVIHTRSITEDTLQDIT